MDLLALFAGILLVTAFAPFSWRINAIISPALLLYCWLNVPAKRAFRRGFLYGIGLFGFGVSWVFVSIHVYGDTAIPLAALITGLFILVLALFPAYQGYLLNRLFKQDKLSKILLAFPASWVLFEWLRSWLFTGFPWLLLSYSQTDSHLHPLAALIGVYGVSFILTLSAGLIVCFSLAVRTQAKKSLIYLLIFIGIHASPLLQPGHWTRVNSPPISVSLVQGNIPQQLKWSPGYIDETLDTYEQLTAPHWGSDIIVWPEAAIVLPPHIIQPFLDMLAAKARQNNATFITGIPIKANAAEQYYNAMIASGAGKGQYHKRYLVPFGEYVPFQKLLRGLINFFDLPTSNIIPGADKQANIRAGNIPIAAFICYEIAYGSALYNALPQAELLITISNDAWFGDSLAPAQHLQIAQFRSQQTGRYQLFVTNDGITAIISPQGEITAQLPQFISGVLTGEVYAMTGSTPWLMMGEQPLLGLMLLLLVIAFLFNRRKANS